MVASEIANVILKIILWIVTVGLAIPTSVLVIECAAAFLKARDRDSDSEAPRPKIAVLMPAHNEAAVIEQTLTTLLPQLEPTDRAIVIADNCSDRTPEIARNAGATVLERQDNERRGKGYALDFGLRALESDPPDVLVMVDADCQVEPGAIDRIARQAAALQKPVQALYLMKQPPSPSPKDAVSALAFLVKNLVRPQGLERLGQPCLLTGTGMAFPWSTIRMVDLASGNIVEDMQLGLDLALVDRAPTFCPEAKVTGIFPAQDAAADSQRTRWEHGHLQTLVSQVPRLAKAAVVQKRSDLLALALDLCVPPLSLLVGLEVVATGVAFLAGMFGLGWQPFAVLALQCVLLAVAIVGAWSKFGRTEVPAKMLLTVPMYVLGKVPLYFKFLVRPQQDWVRTERDTLK